MNKGINILLSGLMAICLLVLMLFTLNRTGDGPTGEPLLVYCAAGMKPPVLQLAQDYELETKQKIQLMYGGSGTLLSNIHLTQQGDLYIPADQSYIELAREQGLVAQTLPLALQRPVLAVLKNNPKNIHTIEDLFRFDVRLALGNPDAASIGRQTRLRFQEAHLWEELKSQIEHRGVFKHTVPEVANDIKLGAVDAGIIWDATVAQYPELKEVPLSFFNGGYKKVRVGVLVHSTQAEAALRFARYLNSPVGNQVFTEHGYQTLDGGS